MKLKKDMECVLLDKKTGAEIFTFSAMQVGDPIFSAGYNGGTSTSPQNMAIATEAEYPYKPIENKVRIDGREWLLTNVTPSIRRKLGAGVAKKPKTIYILNLE